MPLTIEQRAAVVAEAESWNLTPYRGWSCIKGPQGGVDCGQLIYGVFRNAGLVSSDLDLPKDYPLNIGLHQASTEYINLVLRHFREIPESEVQPGDIVVWRLTGSKSYCHGAIIKSWPDYIIHAYGNCVKAANAKSRLRLARSEKLFFTLRTE
jgi:cell wall-associated NlpC family hydrolase